MALDLGAGSLIRSGSGLILLGLGVAIALLLWRGVEQRKLALGLALHGIGSGVAFIVVNIAGKDDALAPVAIVINTIGWLVADVGLLLILAWSGVRGVWRAALVATIVVLTLGWGATAVSLDTSKLTTELTSWAPSAFPFFRLDFFAYQVGWALALLVAAAIAVRHREHPSERRAVALLALGLVVYPALIKGNGILDDPASRYDIIGEVAAVVAMLAVAVVWVRQTETAPRPARVVAPVALACWLVGMSYTLAPFLDLRGIVGFVRIAGVVAVAIAVLRHDLLGSRLASRSVQRGTAATGALAALFIVAQVAQNFLSDAFGLVMGGVVAGALVFAASPIQRAMERMTAASVAPAAPSAAPSGREESYRQAVRLALRDRILSRDEERHLLRLAHHAGIEPARAMEIHDEVERERVSRREDAA